MLYRIKPYFQKFAVQVFGQSISANMASFLGLVCVGLILGVLANGVKFPWLLPFGSIFILLRMMLNALDGLIARARNTANPAGELVNELLDVLGDILSYMGLYWLFGEVIWELVLLCNAIWVCEFIGVIGKCLPNGRRRQESLLGGKPERAIWLGLLLIIAYIRPQFLEAQLGRILIGMSFFVLLSALLRGRAAIKNSRNHAYTSDPLYGR